MNIFLDTNVIVAYSLSLDPWNYYGKKLFNYDYAFYLSETVFQESLFKIKSLFKIYVAFFNEIKELLPKGFITKNEFIKIVKSITHVKNREIKFNKNSLANYIWNDGGWFLDASVIEIKKVLDNIIENLKIETHPKFRKCINRLNLIKEQIKIIPN